MEENNESFSELNIKKENKDEKSKTNKDKQIKNDKDEEKRSEKNGFNLIRGRNREESYFACISMLIEYFEMPTRSESIKRGAQIVVWRREVPLKTKDIRSHLLKVLLTHCSIHL